MSDEWWRAVIGAVEALNLEALEQTLASGIEDTFESDEHPFAAVATAVAADRRALALADTLAAAGIDLNRADRKGGSPLGLAAAKSLELTELLVARGASVNPEDPSVTPPLATAAAAGRISIAERLLEAGADVNAAYGERRKRTPLFGAAGVEMVRLLLRHGGDPNPRGPDGARMKLPLVQSARSGAVDVAELLLHSGAEIDAPDHSGFTAFGIAAFYQNEVLDVLRARGAALNPVPGPDGFRPVSPLMGAVRGRRVALVRELLAQSADPNHLASNGATPLSDAAYRSPELVRLLLDHGAVAEPTPIGDIVPSQPLGEAIYDESVESVRALLEAGADPSGRGAPLALAAFYKLPELVALLLEHGADPNQPDEGGCRPLAGATEPDEDRPRESVLRVFSLLLDAGADPELATSEDDHPLMNALCESDLEVASLLVDRGADPSRFESAALCYCLSLEADEPSEELDALIRQLLVAGARVNVRPDDGATPLELAVENDDRARFELLLRYGADPHHENKWGDTIFDMDAPDWLKEALAGRPSPEERAASLAHPCFLPTVTEGPGDPGGPRFGGLPFLNADESWPCYEGAPMSLFVQLNLDALPIDAGAGLLRFFYDTSAADDEGFAILLAPMDAAGAVAEAPGDALVFPARAITGWSPAPADAPGDKLGGLADWIQSPTYPSDDEGRLTRLLLQLTGRHVEYEWGDGGNGYLFQSEADPSRVALYSECY